MASLRISLLLLLFVTFLRLTSSTKIGITYNPSASTKIGITYNPSASTSLPPPERVVATLRSLHISAVRLLDPTPAAVRAFSYTNISVLLSVPNHFIPSFSNSTSATSDWLSANVLPFHPRTKITMISVGSDTLSDPDFEPSTTLIPAIINLRTSLIQLGIKTIPVSTTLSFLSIISKSFPPSTSEFTDPANTVIITPLLQFLEETNSSFLVSMFPYNIYRSNAEVPVAFALFQEHPFNFRDDLVTGVRYWNLFDMMVDSVIAAMTLKGKGHVPVIVAETGWPSNEAHVEGNFAEMYLKGLVSHVRSGLGTPLRKEGAAEVYVYQLFDNDAAANGTEPAGITGEKGQEWGIMYPNMTSKYHYSFTGSSNRLMVVDFGDPVFVFVVSTILLQLLICGVFH